MQFLLRQTSAEFCDDQLKDTEMKVLRLLQIPMKIQVKYK